MRRATVVAVLTTMAVSIVTAPIASANPAAAAKWFKDGRKLLKQGKLAEACDAFRKSNDLEPRAGTLLNLAGCEEKRGRVATAWVTFEDARALALQTSDKLKIAEANKRAKELEKVLPYLTIKTPADKPAGFTVKRDGKELASGELDAELPIDPGTYEIEATAPDHVAWRSTATVVVKQRAVLEIPALEAVPAPPTTTTTPTPAAPTTTAAVPVPPANGDGSPSVTEPLPPRSEVQRRIGVGAIVGITNDVDPIGGARIPFQIASAGRGTIRIVPTFTFTRADGVDGDASAKRDVISVGAGIEYTTLLAPKLAIAAGIGLGVDFIDRTYFESRKGGFGALRISPTMRVAKAVDIALHLQLVGATNHICFDSEGDPEDCIATHAVAQVGVDYFFY